MKSESSAIVALIIAGIIGVLVLILVSEPVEKTEQTQDFKSRQVAELIHVTSPEPNQEIASPLVVEGQARGSWFFEANFPIMLLDENSNVLANAIATAVSDWMTENFVPFRAELKFASTDSKSGFLILHNNNPSGLSENNKELKIPVAFRQIAQVQVPAQAPAQTQAPVPAKAETMTIKVFYGNETLDPEFSVYETFPVQRQIPKTLAAARTALEELLKGPTEKEKAQGFYTSINQGVVIQKLSIENGVAKIDFSKQLDFQVAGSARVLAIRAQIEQTLKQFPTVKDVIISINTRTEAILQP